MARRQRLELTWIGKDHQPKLEPRILIEDPAKSYGTNSPFEGGQGGCNMLIYGDNLLALKALEQDFAGKIKCIYIDPPYNTGVAFEQYEDGLEHSIWLNLMKPRVELLRNLLTPDGSIWVSLDDNEAHYFKVLGDEIFGRNCFIADISWVKRDGPPNDRKIGAIHEHILVWGRQRQGNSKQTDAEIKFNLLPRSEKANSQYKIFPEPDGPDIRGPFRKIDTTANAKGGRYVESLYYPIKNPYTDEDVWPRKGTCWRHNKEEMLRLQEEKRLYWGVKGASTTPMRKLFLSEVRQGMTTPSVWSDLALNQHASAEMEYIFGQKAAFETPKPEALIERIVHIASNPGDWVLDSFLGSGTTAAVAHKMGRKWIGIELGEHCHTHCLPRLQKVVDGTDQGGISKVVNWKGGGGFKYYYLAPSLLKKDRYGHWVIDERYNPDMLAAAMAKHEGFRYSPDEEVYWKQGQSTEKDFIYTTTQFVTVELLDKIHEEMKPDESLLITCKAFQEACERRHANITVKKIPNMLLGRCEFGKEDYSLNIVNMPVDPDAPEFVPQGPEIKKKNEPEEKNQLDLFSADDKVVDAQKDREDL